jgi:hypothetical protein
MRFFLAVWVLALFQAAFLWSATFAFTKSQNLVHSTFGHRSRSSFKYSSRVLSAAGGDFFENFKKLWGGDDSSDDPGTGILDDYAAGTSLIASIPGACPFLSSLYDEC